MRWGRGRVTGDGNIQFTHMWLPTEARRANGAASYRKRAGTFLLWHARTGSVSGALGRRFEPHPAQWVKGACVPQLWRRSQQQRRSDPWPRNSICYRVAKKEKKKKSGQKHISISILKSTQCPNTSPIEKRKWALFKRRMFVCGCVGVGV